MIMQSDMKVDLPGFNQLRKCKEGWTLYNKNDQTIGKCMELYGEFSEGEVQLFKALIKPGDVVMEIGAHIGNHTMVFAKAIGPEGFVLAYEPQRIVYQTLCANMALNSILNAYLYNEAISDKPGSMFVPVLDPEVEQIFGGHNLEGHAEGDTIVVRTLDNITVPKCDFVKIDVEGMEAKVIRGGNFFFTKYRPIIYVENDRPELSGDLIRSIDSLGYIMYWHMPPIYNSNNYYGNSENIFGAMVSVNMICIPNEKAEQFVLTDARPVEIPLTGDGIGSWNEAMYGTSIPPSREK